MKIHKSNSSVLHSFIACFVLTIKNNTRVSPAFVCHLLHILNLKLLAIVFLI